VVEGVVNKLTPGQEVNVTIPAVSSEPIKAVIDTISPSVNTMTQLYPVKIYLENPDGKIKPGMFANVEMALDVRKDVLAVASEAVLLKDGKNVVYIVQDGKAVEREVKVGLDTGSEVEILEGLKEGDTIIINGQHYVEDGGTVKVVGGEEK
jgi:RND family efflux transporter MFP subunit